MLQEQLAEQKNAKFETLISEGSEKLSWAAPKAPMSFRFIWEKMHFSAKLDHLDDQHRLRLLGSLGPLPFSAEKPGYRERLLRILAWDCDNDRVRFVLDPKRHHIYLMIDDHLANEITGLDLLTSAVTSLLYARPFIELAKEIGWQHPSDTLPKDYNVIPKCAPETPADSEADILEPPVNPPAIEKPNDADAVPETGASDNSPPTIIVKFN